MSRRGPKSERIGQKKPKSRSVQKEAVANSENKSQEKKGEWIGREELNEQGKPIIPRNLIKATEKVIYDPEKYKDLEIVIITGYAPAGFMGTNDKNLPNKLYDIQKLTIEGWRAKAEAIIELSPYRDYEKDWFDAFKGTDVCIDPAPKDGHTLNTSTEYNMKVIETSFKKKIKIIENIEKPVFEGRIFMIETYKSVYARNKSRIFQRIIWIIIPVIISAIITALVTLWVTNFFSN